MSETDDRYICGVCGETCGNPTKDGNGAYQCETFGTLWSDDEGVGIAYIAKLLSVQRATVDQWRQRRSARFPAPDWSTERTGAPLWKMGTILRWAKSTGRL